MVVAPQSREDVAGGSALVESTTGQVVGSTTPQVYYRQSFGGKRRQPEEIVSRQQTQEKLRQQREIPEVTAEASRLKRELLIETRKELSRRDLTKFERLQIQKEYQKRILDIETRKEIIQRNIRTGGVREPIRPTVEKKEEVSVEELRKPRALEVSAPPSFFQRVKQTFKSSREVYGKGVVESATDVTSEETRRFVSFISKRDPQLEELGGQVGKVAPYFTKVAPALLIGGGIERATDKTKTPSERVLGAGEFLIGTYFLKRGAGLTRDFRTRRDIRIGGMGKRGQVSTYTTEETFVYYKGRRVKLKDLPPEVQLEFLDARYRFKIRKVQGKTEYSDFTKEEKFRNIDELLSKAKTPQQKSNVEKYFEDIYGTKIVQEYKLSRPKLFEVLPQSETVSQPELVTITGVVKGTASSIEPRVSQSIISADIRTAPDVKTDIKTDTKPTLDIKTTPDVIIASRPSLNTKVKTTQEEETITSPKTIFDVTTTPDTIVTTRQRQETRFERIPSLSFDSRQLSDFTTSGRITKEKAKKEKIRRIIPISFPESIGEKKKGLKRDTALRLFEAVGYRFGQEVTLGKGTKIQAERKLSTFLTTTLGASGFLRRESGKKVKATETELIKLPQFRESKEDIFRIVERKERRIKRGTSEAKEIQFFRKKKGGKKRSILSI